MAAGHSACTTPRDVRTLHHYGQHTCPGTQPGIVHDECARCVRITPAQSALAPLVRRGAPDRSDFARATRATPKRAARTRLSRVRARALPNSVQATRGLP